MNITGGRARKQMLTPREREILDFVTKGFDNEEIAEDLDITLEEVLRSQAKLLRKMDSHDIPQAIKSILKERLIFICQ